MTRAWFHHDSDTPTPDSMDSFAHDFNILERQTSIHLHNRINAQGYVKGWEILVTLVFCILVSLLFSFFVIGSIRFNRPIVPNNLEQKRNCLGKQTNRQRHRLEFLYRLNKFAMNFETRPHSQNVCSFIRDSLVSYCQIEPFDQ